MRLRTVHAEDMQRAMDQVRYEFGEEAVIIATNRNPLGKGVSITVAQPDEDDHEEAAFASSDTSSYAMIPDYFIRDLEMILEHHGTSAEVIDVVLSEARRLPNPSDDSAASIRKILADALAQSFNFQPVAYETPGTRMMLIGSPGMGKTLTASKIISRLVKTGQPVHIITTDCKRAGGVEQLAAITNILGLELHIAGDRAELKSQLATIDRHESVVIDSAGANPYDYHELKELAEFAGLLEIEPVLVYAAGGDPVEASEISQAFSFLGVEKLIVTRTDIAKRYGSLLTAAYAARLTFSHITGTEKVLGEFRELTPDTLAELLMRHRKD